MRKRIGSLSPGEVAPNAPEWLDLDKFAEVEITSEDPRHPIDSALIPGGGEGWKAIQSLKQIRLVFTENELARTQEFVLRWSGDGITFHEIVRQQYNFNPPATETEEYTVALTGVKMLELKIVPHIGGGTSMASLTKLRVA